MSVAGSDVVLSNYPLSRAFRERIEVHVGSAVALFNVAELRQASLMRLLRTLRGLQSQRLFVAIEDEGSAT